MMKLIKASVSWFRWSGTRLSNSKLVAENLVFVRLYFGSCFLLCVLPFIFTSCFCLLTDFLMLSRVSSFNVICCCGLTVFTCVLLTCVSLFNVVFILTSVYSTLWLPVHEKCLMNKLYFLTYIYVILVKTRLVYVSCALLLCTFSDCLLSMYFSIAETFLDSCHVDFVFRPLLMFAFVITSLSRMHFVTDHKM